MSRNYKLLSSILLSIWAVGCTTASTGHEAAESEIPLPECSKCDHLEKGPVEDLGKRFRGQALFESAAPFWDFLPIRALEATAADSGSNRSVEEADVYKHDADSGLLYVLNSYRGLQVIDVKNADAPELIGRAPLGGWPVEMYVEGDQAFVLLNAQVEPGQAADENDHGAVLRVFDLSNPKQPVETTEFKIPGTIAGSKLLSTEDDSSTVIYVASNIYSWQAGGSSETTFVMSIDVTNPAQPVAVDRVDFDGAGWQSHVTPKAMFIADHDWSDDQTVVRYVDISDLGGDIVVRGSIAVEGRLAWGDKGELQMDHFEGHLRIASQVRGNFFEGTPSFIQISTIDTTDADSLTVSGGLKVGEGHRLLAARFSGDKAYLFHMVQVDPLEVIDLSNPAEPTSLGILKIDGWVNHIEVRGDKLITIGVNDVDDRKLALIMFDVSNPSAPVELSRATAGEKWAWTSANHDLKSFRLIDDLGVALLPVSSSSFTEENGYQFKSWLQLFSYDTDAGKVSTRGEINGVGGFKRAIPVDGGILAFGDQSLTTVSLQNLDAPAVTSTLELAKNVVDFTTVGPFGVMAVASGQWGNQNVELRVVPLHDPDNSNALATLDLGLPEGRLYKLDEQHLAYLASDSVGGETLLATLSFADPFEPKLLKTIKLPQLGFFGWGGFAPAPGPDTKLVGDALAVYTWPSHEEESGAKLRIINLENRAFPHESAMVELGTGTIVDMTVKGSKLFVTSYEPVPVELEEGIEEGEVLATTDVASADVAPIGILPGGPISPFFRTQKVAYSLRIIDLADPEAPVVSDAISVPGRFVGEKDLGFGPWQASIIYTMDSLSTDAGMEKALDTLLLIGNKKARLIDVFGLPQNADNVILDGDMAYLSLVNWNSGGFGGAGRLIAPPSGQPTFSLKAIDLSRPYLIKEAGSAEFTTVGWGSLTAVKDGLAFVSANGRLLIVDVSNEKSMAIANQVATFGWWSGKMHFAFDSRLYLPSGLYGLHVIDL